VNGLARSEHGMAERFAFDDGSVEGRSEREGGEITDRPVRAHVVGHPASEESLGQTDGGLEPVEPCPGTLPQAARFAGVEEDQVRQVLEPGEIAAGQKPAVGAVEPGAGGIRRIEEGVAGVMDDVEAARVEVGSQDIAGGLAVAAFGDADGGVMGEEALQAVAFGLGAFEIGAGIDDQQDLEDGVLAAGFEPPGHGEVFGQVPPAQSAPQGRRAERQAGHLPGNARGKGVVHNHQMPIRQGGQHGSDLVCEQESRETIPKRLELAGVRAVGGHPAQQVLDQAPAHPALGGDDGCLGARCQDGRPETRGTGRCAFVPEDQVERGGGDRRGLSPGGEDADACWGRDSTFGDAQGCTPAR